MERFDEVARSIDRARRGAPADPVPSALPGLTVLDVDEVARRLRVEVDADGWVREEPRRAESLASANAARLAGWRLERVLHG